MNPLKKLFEKIKEYFVQYPAVLSGYIIYSYFFITTMSFYKEIKKASMMNKLEVFMEFDALIWMWLLAAALVKIITYRSKVLEQERIRINQQKELEMHQTQLNTMKEVIRTLQHEINNPLAIIMGFLNQAEKEAENLPEILNDLKEIKTGAYRIKKTLIDFSNANAYQTVDSPVGQMAQPKRTDEES